MTKNILLVIMLIVVVIAVLNSAIFVPKIRKKGVRRWIHKNLWNLVDS